MVPRNEDVERVAETHFMIRPVLENALRSRTFTPEGQKALATHAANYLEYWEQTLSGHWFDMASLVRLGTGIETGLRKTFTRLAPSSVDYDNGTFQRLVKSQQLEELFHTHCAIDLAGLPRWIDMREIMVHRHLYSHRSGLIDDKYTEDLKLVTGTDIRPDLAMRGYPAEDVFWFEPLTRLHVMIENARSFFAALPDA